MPAPHKQSRARRVPRLLTWLAVGVAVVVIVLGAQTAFAAFWVWRDSSALERAIQQARTAIVEGRFADAARDMDEVTAAATSLSEKTAESTWSRAQHLPLVGSSFTAMHALTDSAASVAAAAQPLFTRVSGAASTGEGLVALQDSGADLATLAQAVTKAESTISSLPDSGLLFGVGAAVENAKAAMPDLVDATGAATEAVQVLPALVGTGDPVRWLVMLQNPAESRGSGGNFSAFAIVEVVDGKPRIVEAASRKDALDSLTIPYHDVVTAETAALWGPALGDWASFNLSPDFPTVARLAAAGMKQRGTPVDGVVAVDPSAVAAILDGTGPVEHDGVTIDAQNAASFFTKDIYAKYPDFPDVAAKDELAVGLLYAAADSLLARPLAVSQLWESMGRAIDEGHVQAWVTDPAAERWMLDHSIGGQVNQDPGPDVVVALNNATGGKVDAYVTGTAEYRYAQCTIPDDGGAGASSLVQSTVTIDLANDAPQGLPPYVDLRLDDPARPKGSTKLYVTVHGSPGAKASGVNLDGVESFPREMHDAGRPVWGLPIELERGQRSTLIVTLVEPQVAGAAPPSLTVSSTAGGISSSATDGEAPASCVLTTNG